MSGFERAVWYLDIATMLALVVRLASSGLFRRYPWFFSYLAVSFLESATLLKVNYLTDNWAIIYMVGQSIKVLLSILIVLELFRVALESQPALAAFGRNVAIYVTGFALVAGAAGLAIDRSIPAGQSPILHRFFVMQRTADSTVVLFLLVITWFITWFPVRVKSNVALYTLGFVVFFLGDSFSILLLNLLPARYFVPANTTMLCISFVCLGAWLFGMRREGEQNTTVVGHGWNPAAAEQLTGQLQGINAALERFAKH